MSNLSTLPKGDSAWLLRKAIERIIQQVSVLETNIGSSTTGNSANTQIIFNDAGTLRGDAGLTYNKTTDLLTVGAATITGALTGQSSGSFYTGTALPFHIRNSGTSLTQLGDNATIGAGTAFVVGSSDGTLRFQCVGVEQYRIASSGVFSWYDGAGGTRMTLNSTGLGVGVSPSYKVHSVVTSGYAGAFKSSTGVVGGILCGNTVGDLIVGVDASGNGRVTADTSKYLGLGSGGINDRVILDTSGNVGVGVTPSARFHSKAGAVTLGGIIETGGANALLSFADSATSSYTRVQIGSSGNNLVGLINGTQAMTLDASGNLLVGTTSSSETSSVGHKINTSLTAPWLATVGSASTNSNVTSSVYSTGAAAYRFYVGYGGTVFATNTTISAISDARLKENVQDIDVGLGAILALKPRKFDWKEGKGKNIKGDRGFIAQEFEAVFPQLVDEWKDNAPEGEAPYKSVRQDLIPVLVKAIQELTARVEALEA